MIGLTQRQQECLDFLRSYHAAKGIMPSMQEMIDNLQLNSKSGAARILNGLEERGHIRRTYKKARAIELITPDQMQAVLLNQEIFALVKAYAVSQHIGLDTATNELLRGALGAA